MVKQILIIFLSGFAGLALASDPTRPILPGAQVAKTTVNEKGKSKQPLTAIITRNKSRTAIIEGDSYKVGDRYRGNKILKIFNNKVLLSSSTGNFYLTLISKIKK